MTTYHPKPVGLQPHACYHWWSYPGEPPVCANLRTPLILSIATLRAVSDMPVVVFDMSERVNDWGDFPDKLNFRVIRAEPRLTKYQDLVEGWKYLSRIYDLAFYVGKSDLPCDTIMYVDSDVFWLRDPQPFDRNPDRFVFDGYNTGFFYYDRYSLSNDMWYEIFDSYTKAAIYSFDVRDVMRKYVGYQGWYGVWDEMILTYMAHEHFNLFNLTSVNEHATTKLLPYANRHTAKMYHCNGTMVANPVTGAKHSRGLMCLLVKEFYDNVRKVLDQSDLDLIFSKAEQESCLPHQFGLFDDARRLLDTKDENGLFHVAKLLG